MSDPSLVKTLPLQLSFEEPESDGKLLREANHEARSVYNQTIRDARNGVDWNAIHDRVESNLVKNTQQRVVEKALDAMRNYHEYDDYGKPSPKSGPYPLRMNVNEGYTLSEEDGEITFRISPKPYNPIRGTISGSPSHLDILRTALNSDTWKVGTAEAFFSDGKAELHVNVTNTETRIRSPTDSRTVIGIDINEDNIALTALSEDDVVDSLVIDFPEIKRIRHEYFVMRKRIQNAGKSSYDTLFERQEERFVHDAVHKISRAVVRFASQFDRPCIAVEDLNGMRESIDYGTRMNRRLHSLPFHALRTFIEYKAAFDGIPAAAVDPTYTSQGCALTTCGHVEKANRNKHRFKCLACGHQDHADRNASVNIAKRGLKECDQHVPALNSLPTVRKVSFERRSLS